MSSTRRGRPSGSVTSSRRWGWRRFPRCRAARASTPTTFDETKAFAKSLALEMEKRYPKRATSIMRKDVRGGKVFVDWSQNDPHKTTVCAYCLLYTSDAAD